MIKMMSTKAFNKLLMAPGMGKKALIRPIPHPNTMMIAIKFIRSCINILIFKRVFIRRHQLLQHCSDLFHLFLQIRKQAHRLEPYPLYHHPYRTDVSPTLQHRVPYLNCFYRSYHDLEFIILQGI